ncbi:hypothetical protein M5689_024546 [Euphorbia peplus]|nr:hypothetical protein M5689_024546 [Euphorbia peplus]
MCQPDNSPNLNILDLGFFRALQASHSKEPSKTTDELLKAVVKSLENFSTVLSNRIFLSLQLCMIEIMKTRGYHGYKITHINKAKLERQGKLPVRLNCSAILVQDVMQYLNN